MNLGELFPIGALSPAEWLTLAVPVLVALFGGFQWLMSERRRSRERDIELIRWAHEAISCFARTEQVCEDWAPDADRSEARALAAEASALVDQGRLFFPNVREGRAGRGARAERPGKRPSILDELLRVHYVARLAVTEPGEDMRRFRDLLRGARVRFVDSVQREMGKSLRETPQDRAGQPVNPDPRTW